jgi:endoglucanase
MIKMLIPSLFLTALIGACNSSPSVAGLSSVPADRLAKLSTGANVARWFRYPIKETEEYYKSYLGASEIKMIKQMGIKHVRLCIAPKIIYNESNGEINENIAAHVDNAVSAFIKEGLLVVIDIHNENRETEKPEWIDNFNKFWAVYAKRLTKFSPNDVILEIINEPVYDKIEDQWFANQIRLAETIRRNAPKHTLIATGPNWGGIDGLKKLKPLDDKNVIYSFHSYDPFPFSHQGATWAGEASKFTHDVPYPSSPELVAPLLPELEKVNKEAYYMVKGYGENRWNKQKMVERFQEGINWGKIHKVPLYCGEYGVFKFKSRPEHRANWFRDFGSMLKDNSIGWSVWGWDEGFGLDRQTVNGKPVIDTGVAKALGLKP